MRKCERSSFDQMGRLSRACVLGATTLRGNAINYLAELLVASSLGTYATWRLYKLRKRGALPPPPAAKEGANEGATRGRDTATAGGEVAAGAGAAAAPRAPPWSAEGEAFAAWCKMMSSHVLKAGITLSSQALLVALATLIRFENPLWARRLAIIFSFGGELLGSLLSTMSINALKLG